MRFRVLAGAALAALTAGCSSLISQTSPPATGRVKVETRESFYEVFGTTAEELYAQMRAKGLRVSRSILFGDYRWDLHWKLRHESSWAGGSCHMTDVLVTLDAQAVLPQWRAPAEAPADLRTQWAAFVRGLQIHEKGHADIAQRAAQEIKNALQKLQAPDCGQMQAVADRLVRNLLQHHRDVEAQYDQDTRYGATQGANWPPPALSGANASAPLLIWGR